MERWQKQFYNSKIWEQTRLSVLVRDQYTCRECGVVIADKPQVHHMVELTKDNYLNPGISLNFEILRTLCHGCHDKVHERFGNKQKETIVNDKLEIDYERR